MSCSGWLIGPPAYPRRCGENAEPVPAEIPLGGLPPQVRGELAAGERQRVGPGLTPAGAGRTTWSPTATGMWSAYPRRCGENDLPDGTAAAYSGLPPQVRGELVGFERADGPHGLTPAGAGRTRLRVTDPCRWRAYPRRCGENQ